MSRAIYSRWYCGHVCAGFCKSTLGTREFCEMAFQKSRNFISEFWWDPWTKLSYIEMVVMTQNKISPGIVINHVDRSFHVLIVTTSDISMIPSFEIWSYMLLELLHCYPVGIYAESNHRNKLWMELKPHWFKNALARNGFPGTCTKFMMTSSNENIFCVTFPLWHVCSGFLGTLKIREFLKMALEK